ncbi:acyl-CoA thioesterase [Salsipaludibacter albus]|uniref:acyl-CoA thioesterase n=1 Tax=Salsipaludibacter albus TaxID=2849650 RepID=UPI001EE3F2D0|nr:acyl-CoA thioesterase II [Salsipaludibacter albus]MBY5162938.1 acyl-CoA thioesterase II [Salsipaludibacter albus]
MDDISEPDLDPVTDLLEVLDLEEVGRRHIEVSGDGEAGRTGTTDALMFRGRSQPQPHGRVFGGQVLAQCVIAAGRTVEAVDGDDRHIHSLHGYFLRPGDSERGIEFVVERMRDGRSFSARRVHAVQDGNILLSMITSFQAPAGGLDHQDTMPDVPDPETLPSAEEALAGTSDPRVAMFARRRALDLRHVDGQVWASPSPVREPRQRVWIKARGELPDDPLLHAAVLAYSSDYTLLEPVLRRHGVAWSDPRLRPASLDHAMWFHRPPRIDQWTLYTQSSPSAQGGRGLGLGRMFTRDGTLVATVAQEGMLRIKE